MINQKKIQSLFTYNQQTGVFRFKFNRGRAKIGNVAGTVLTCNGYLRVMIDNKSYYLHRLAFLYVLGYMPREVDHRNRKVTDNRWSNLRETERSGNGGNKPRNRNNTTGYKGVFKHGRGYIVRCANVYIGYFSDAMVAARAYDAAAKEHFGKFAHTNRCMGLR